LFAARERGETAGVTTRGGQPVFASPASPRGVSRSAARPKKSAARTSAPAASERSAVGDVWSGFASRSPRGYTAALASSPDSPAGASTIAIAMLGLGLAGVLGTVAVAVAPRRRRARAAARATGGTKSGDE